MREADPRAVPYAFAGGEFSKGNLKPIQGYIAINEGDDNPWQAKEQKIEIAPYMIFLQLLPQLGSRRPFHDHDNSSFFYNLASVRSQYIKQYSERLFGSSPCAKHIFTL
jgi:hypothetical protein